MPIKNKNKNFRKNNQIVCKKVKALQKWNDRSLKQSVASQNTLIKKATHLLRVDEAVVVQVLVVHGEASHPSHLRVTGLVHALAHHQHRVVHHTGRALSHGVHTNNVNDINDPLEKKNTVMYQNGLPLV